MEIDYRFGHRLGSKTAQGKIILCGKCGKKGVYRHVHMKSVKTVNINGMNVKVSSDFESVTHKIENHGRYGLQIKQIIEYCDYGFYWTPEEVQKSCAMERCDKLVFSTEFYSTHYPAEKKFYFCSHRCLEGYQEWCIWQKYLGNGIELAPPEWGGQVKEEFITKEYFNTEPIRIK